MAVLRYTVIRTSEICACYATRLSHIHSIIAVPLRLNLYPADANALVLVILLSLY